MSAPSSFAPPRLELRGISKRYPGCLANDRIDLCIDAGEIHALLGENGAGKSTLMKIIYGVTRPDAGEVRWQGEPVQVRDPARARALGIGMVFQHFSLFETLSVAENIALALGAEAGSPRRLEARIREVSQRYGMPLEPRRLVHGLSIGERQRVEIVRCLMQDIRLLILDEPTSVLTPREAEDLFVTLRRLAEEGCSVLFISHKLAEVRALCQRATVLRGGRVAGQCVPAQCSDLELARLMVGDAEGLAAEYPKATGGAPFLQVRDLHWRNLTPSACPSPASIWRCAAARSSVSPGSPATARTSCSLCSAAKCACRAPRPSASASAAAPARTWRRMRGAAPARPSCPPSGWGTARCRR